tara:strand:+ start:176 stop:790 length:615 start_codon:yes stop_codon:yes gene_type:complete
MLLANNLSFIRGEKQLFKEIDISLSPNSIVQIKGRNGIGKTTLIKILSNIILPSSGKVYWNSKNIKNNKDFYKNLTYIMDSHTSKKDLTVLENTKFWHKLFSSKIKFKELESILELLSLNKSSKVEYLSMGEKRKLELSRLVIEQKKLWILDEPFLGLDSSSTDLINETFKNHIKNDGMIIFASHYNPEINEINILQLEDYANI